MQRLSYFAFIILGLTGTIHGMALPFLIEDFGLSLSLAGLLLFVNSAGYLLASIAFPFLQKRYNATKLLFIAFLLIVISYAAFPLSSWWSLLLALAFLASLGTGTVDVGFNTLISSLEATIAQSALNWLHFSYGIGALVGPAFLSRLLNLGLSWRSFYLSASVLSLAFLAFWTDQVKKTRERKPVTESHEKSSELYKETVFLMLLTAIFIYVAVEVALVGWVPTFLTSLGVSATNASLGISVLWLGIALGRALCSQIVQHVRPKSLLLFLTSGAALGMVLLLFINSLWIIFSLLFIIGLFLSAIFPLIMLQSASLFPRAVAQSASALVVAGSFGAMIGPAFLGLIGQYYSLQFGIMLLASVLFLSTFIIGATPNTPSQANILVPGDKSGPKGTLQS